MVINGYGVKAHQCHLGIEVRTPTWSTAITTKERISNEYFLFIIRRNDIAYLLVQRRNIRIALATMQRPRIIN